MSHVRMCDTCASVFSENAEGWSSGNMTVMQRNPASGRMEPVSISQDKCPSCTELMSTAPTFGQPEVQPTYNKSLPAAGNDSMPGGVIDYDTQK
jgi:hypothetical protein